MGFGGELELYFWYFRFYPWWKGLTCYLLGTTDRHMEVAFFSQISGTSPGTVTMEFSCELDSPVPISSIIINLFAVIER